MSTWGVSLFSTFEGVLRRTCTAMYSFDDWLIVVFHRINNHYQLFSSSFCLGRGF